jgi:hypothetical protein
MVKSEAQYSYHLLCYVLLTIFEDTGDKIGEILALADEAGIEPAFTMYSRPAFARCLVNSQWQMVNGSLVSFFPFTIHYLPFTS